MMTPAGTGVGDGEVGGDGVGLVLDVDHAVLRQPAHAAEQHLGVALDELGAAGEVGVEPLELAVVQREDVVLAGLDQEQPLQVAQPVGMLGGHVVGLGPVVGGVQLPDVVVERRQLLAATPTGWSGGSPRSSPGGRCRG